MDLTARGQTIPGLANTNTNTNNTGGGAVEDDYARSPGGGGGGGYNVRDAALGVLGYRPRKQSILTRIGDLSRFQTSTKIEVCGGGRGGGVWVCGALGAAGASGCVGPEAWRVYGARGGVVGDIGCGGRGRRYQPQMQ